MRFFYLILTLFYLPFCFANNDSYLLVSGTANLPLAEKIAKCLSKKLTSAVVSRFNDGEIQIKIDENVRNAEVYLIQSICSTNQNTVNDNLMELYLLIRTLRRAAAGTITAVIPYYSYARQDRKTESRVPISASDVAMLLEQGGADHIICVDLHCGQIQGFFHGTTVDNLYAAPIFVRYFSSKSDLINPVVVSPDAGGVERAKKFIEGLSCQGVEAGLAVIVKQRASAGVIEKMNLVGDVVGRDAIIVDDICDTAGTLVQAAQELKNQGANRVFACITHPVFSGPALERIRNSCLMELVATDTIPAKTQFPSNVVQLSIAPLIAEAIHRTHHSQSVSQLFTYNEDFSFCKESFE